MARIPDEVVERLKREVSVARLAEARGIVLKKHGENLLGLCPFHADREPSLVVTPQKNLWHCLGACQAGGSVIDWVMRTEGCSFTAALQMLLQHERVPAFVVSAEERRGRTTSAKLEPIATGDESDDALMLRVVAHYQSTLKGSGEGLAYLGKRRIESHEAIEHFKLGYANRTLGYRLPAGQVKAGGAIRGQLQRLGVYRESGHEHFNGSLTIPIFDAEGRLVQMYGRKVREDLRPGTSKHLYLSRPHTAVWNVSALGSSKEVILCESLIDALTFWCAGLRHVITSYGVEGFTRAHVEALRAHGTQKVLVAYDRDEAGDKAAEKLAPELASLGASVFRVVFPRGMDANEYAQKMKPVGKSLETALRSAQWMAGARSVQVPSDVVPAQEKAAQSAEAQATEEKMAARDLVEACAQVAPSADAVSSAAAPEADPIPSLVAPPDAPAVREAVAAATSATMPAPPEPGAIVTEGEAQLHFGPRQWRVRGLDKVTSVSSIKVNVRVSMDGAFFMDSFDVCQARARAAFTKQAAEELGIEERVLKLDLGRVLNELEVLVEVQLRKTLEPVKKAPVMSTAEESEALALLKNPRLLDRILEDFARCGVVGEETNKLVAYLASISRKLEEPLAVVIQSSSAAGKSSLMDAVLRLVPEEEQVSYSAMTGQSLFYMGGTDLQHKVLAIAEEEGATNAAYALKLLQSAGELTIASTGKDPATGRLVTQEYRVTGPVMVMLTTTRIDIDEELLNRCLVLTVDEGAAQTQAIQRMQREARTLEGLRAKLVRGQVMQLHQNAQRLLKPISIVNPYAPELSFASHATRTRRDHKKYLGLIDAIALLHQHQRPVKTAEVGTSTLRYIEVTREDIALANRLAARVLAHGLDELSPPTRRLLGVIESLVKERAQKEGVERAEVRFTQRDVREVAALSVSQLKVHLRTLVELEYLALHRSRHAQRHVFELLAGAPEGDGPFSDAACEYDRNRPVDLANRPVTGLRSDRPVFLRDDVRMGEPAGVLGDAHTALRVNGTPYVHVSGEPAAAE